MRTLAIFALIDAPSRIAGLKGVLRINPFNAQDDLNERYGFAN
jgi:hypothetical protein